VLDLQLGHRLLGLGLRRDADPERAKVRGELGVEARVVAEVAVDVCLAISITICRDEDG
jgi:hypothetical protein